MNCRGNYWVAEPIWRGETVVCIASGESLTQEDVDLCRGRRVIVVNDNWRKAPWANALFAIDYAWWRLKGPKPQEFAGLRVTTSDEEIDCLKMHWERSGGLSEDQSCLVTGANSGYAAVALAVHLNAGAPIILLGYDMGGEHWFGRHEEPLRNPNEENFKDWRCLFRELADEARRRKITIINASRKTALTCFPQMGLEEALERTREPA